MAVVVSIVHYTDNYVNYDDFPHGSGPEPTAAEVLIAWFAFTGFGLLGYWLYRRGEIRRGALALLVYSGSGLVGIGHYTVPGMTDAPILCQGHVVFDILLGLSMAAFAIWSIVALPRVASVTPDGAFVEGESAVDDGSAARVPGRTRAGVG